MTCLEAGLVLNSGSSSVKFALMIARDTARLIAGG
jgi:acetate kinase